jgi:hypothetical protein
LTVGLADGLQAWPAPPPHQECQGAAPPVPKRSRLGPRRTGSRPQDRCGQPPPTRGRDHACERFHLAGLTLLGAAPAELKKSGNQARPVRNRFAPVAGPAPRPEALQSIIRRTDRPSESGNPAAFELVAVFDGRSTHQVLPLIAGGGRSLGRMRPPSSARSALLPAARVPKCTAKPSHGTSEKQAPVPYI